MEYDDHANIKHVVTVKGFKMSLNFSNKVWDQMIAHIHSNNFNPKSSTIEEIEEQNKARDEQNKKAARDEETARLERNAKARKYYQKVKKAKAEAKAQGIKYIGPREKAKREWAEKCKELLKDW